MTDRNSFVNIQDWIGTLRDNTNAGQIITTLILGNKTDLLRRKVSQAEGSALAHKISCAFAEVSAKEGTNLESSFTDLAQNIWTHRTSRVQSEMLHGKYTKFESIELNAIPLHHSGESKCCKKLT